MRGRASACASPQTTVRVERCDVRSSQTLCNVSHQLASCTRTHRWCAGRESTPEEKQLHTIVWGYFDDNNPLLRYPRALYHPQHHHDQTLPRAARFDTFPTGQVKSSQVKKCKLLLIFQPEPPNRTEPRPRGDGDRGVGSSDEGGRSCHGARGGVSVFPRTH
jgi:hypothetical protein